MNFLNILFYSLLVGLSWGLTYYFLRRLPNPNLALYDETGKQKKDLETQRKIEEYYYDAIYGGFAIGVSHLLVRLFREGTQIQL